jgi:hypothetical protein
VYKSLELHIGHINNNCKQGIIDNIALLNSFCKDKGLELNSSLMKNISKIPQELQPSMWLMTREGKLKRCHLTSINPSKVIVIPSFYEEDRFKNFHKLKGHITFGAINFPCLFTVERTVELDSSSAHVKDYFNALSQELFSQESSILTEASSLKEDATHKINYGLFKDKK